MTGHDNQPDYRAPRPGLRGKLDHLLGLDHWPSLCFESGGRHEAARIASQVGGPEPGPWRCGCRCRRCQSGRCPHVLASRGGAGSGHGSAAEALEDET